MLNVLSVLFFLDLLQNHFSRAVIVNRCNFKPSLKWIFAFILCAIHVFASSEAEGSPRDSVMPARRDDNLATHLEVASGRLLAQNQNYM